jgi:hypothetical protein
MSNKLTDFKKFIERIDDDAWSSTENDWSNDDVDHYDDEYYGHNYTKKDTDDDEDDSDSGMEHIKYLLRTMFKNKGIDNYYINSKNLDIEISIIMRDRERLSDVVNLFDILKKLKKDILPQYESEFNMWTNRKNEQVLEAVFLYDDDYFNREDDDDDENIDENYKKNIDGLPF